MSGVQISWGHSQWPKPFVCPLPPPTLLVPSALCALRKHGQEEKDLMARANLLACWSPALNSAGLPDAAAQLCLIPAAFETTPDSVLSISSGIWHLQAARTVLSRVWKTLSRSLVFSWFWVWFQGFCLFGFSLEFWFFVIFDRSCF